FGCEHRDLDKSIATISLNRVASGRDEEARIMPVHGRKDRFLSELLAQPFPGEWESWLLANMAHFRLLSDAERSRLRDDARVLIAEKRWEGCDGLKVTEMMKLTVAAQAALLLLGLEHDHFSRVLSIVLFPSAFELPAESPEERG